MPQLEKPVPYNKAQLNQNLKQYIYFFKKRSTSGVSSLKVKVTQRCLILCDPMDYIVKVYGILQASILGWVAFPYSPGSSQPSSPTLQADSLLAEPQRKPKNTGVGNLSLLQWIFPTQELNQSLLHCRWILY